MPGLRRSAADQSAAAGQKIAPARFVLASLERLAHEAEALPLSPPRGRRNVRTHRFRQARERAFERGGDGLAALGETPADDVPTVARVTALVGGDLTEHRLHDRILRPTRQLCDDARGHAFVERAVDERIDRERCEGQRSR